MSNNGVEVNLHSSVRLIMAPNQEPLPEFYERCMPETGPFIRKEMQADAVEFLNRYEFPFEYVETEELKTWAAETNFKYTMTERKFQLVGNETQQHIMDIFLSSICFETQRDHMLFKLTWL